MSDPVIYPVVQGDWVAEVGDGQIIVARVRQTYGGEGGEEVLMDLVYYDTKGVKIGRQSPAEGGPKTFEPAVPFDERWTRIEPPQFPLKQEVSWTPSEVDPSKKVGRYTYYHDGRQAARVKPVRTTVRKQSRDYSRRPNVVFVPAEPSNNIEMEIAGLKRSAQELRDAARLLSPLLGGDVLRDRAVRLEDEAAALQEKA